MPYIPVSTVADSRPLSALLLVNMGSPERLTKAHVKQFIGDMLSDPYVMDIPDPFRNMLSRRIIAPLRANSSFEKYGLIWEDSPASPLALRTVAIGQRLEQITGLPTAVSMRYGSPSPEEAIVDLLRYFPSIKTITLLPLFPQYAESSYVTAVEAVRAAANKTRTNIQVVEPFYNHPHYIKALSEKIRSHTPEGFQKLVFSFHSLPMSHVERGRSLGNSHDYEFQCRETARLTAQQLELSDDQYIVVYASAIGSRWLKPDLNRVMDSLPRSGCNDIAVVAPGFLVDNLETLYDININARSIFTDGGGLKFHFVPCLNEDFADAASVISSNRW